MLLIRFNVNSFVLYHVYKTFKKEVNCSKEQTPSKCSKDLSDVQPNALESIYLSYAVQDLQCTKHCFIFPPTSSSLP